MPVDTASLRVYLALYDSAHHDVQDMHWTWYHTNISTQLRKAFYSGVIAPKLTAFPLAKPNEVIWGGFASIDEVWCCWFRLFGAGRDLRGRPGRYLMPVLFCRREECRGIDAQSVFSADPYRLIADLATQQAPPPLPRLSHLELQLQAPRVIPDPELAELLRLETRLTPRKIGQLTALGAACSLANADESWRVFVRGQTEDSTVEASLLRPQAEKLRPSAKVPPREPDVAPQAAQNPTTILARPPVSQITTVSAPRRVRKLIVQTAIVGMLVAMSSLLLVRFVREKRAASDAHVERGQLAESVPRHFDDPHWPDAFDALISSNDPQLQGLGETSQAAFKNGDLGIQELIATVQQWQDAAQSEQDEGLRSALERGAMYWLTREAMYRLTHEVGELANSPPELPPAKAKATVDR